MSHANNTLILKSAGFKIIIIGLVLGFVFAGSSSYLAHQYMGKTKDQRLLYLKQAAQIARNSIEPILVDYRDLNISMEDALEQVRNLVRRMIYTDHTGKNYIFMSAYDGTMLVQPFEPDKEMTDMWNLKDAYGVYIIRALVKAAKSKDGQGYVSYYYQRPGETSAQEKISFVIGIPELGCYIGTGQYMADIRKSQADYVIMILGLTLILLFLLFSLVWASMKEIRTQNTMLHKAERELQGIFDNTFQFIGTLTPEGTLIKANRSSLKLIRKNEKDVIGKRFWETPWWPGEEIQDRLKKAIHECSKGKFCRFETVHLNKRQGEINVDFNLSPIIDNQGQVISILAEGRDISEQTEIRNDLVREKVFFNHIIESLPSVFALYKEEDGHYVMKKWNTSQYEKLLGYSSEELQNAPMEKFVSEKDLPSLSEAAERLLQKGSISIPIDTKTKDDRIVPILYKATYFEHSGDRFIVAIGIELTEKIKAEKEKKRLEAMLVQAQKMDAMGTLAGGIAHDFNNILSAILGFAELVKSKLPPGTKAVKMQGEVINAAIRAKELVGQILLFSRQSDLEMDPVQPGLVIKEALKLLRSSIPTTIEIRQDIPSDAGTILANATQIHQIIMNLCTNAYHAMRRSGGILTVSLTEQEIHQGNPIYAEISLNPGVYLLLDVSDTGHGMDRNTLDKIFDPYFTTKEKGEGTGLGLSVVHGIVKNFGGEIIVDSELGKGTTVSIYFPKLDDGIQKDKEPEDACLQTGSEHILLVDDDPMVIDMTMQSLTDLGYNVTAFSSSRQALDAFGADPDSFDLVITDMTMPEITGMDLSKALLNSRPRIPIILCTGYSELITRETAIELGIKSFLLKPVLRETLSGTIRDVLDKDQA